MQTFTDANREVLGEWYVVRYEGNEIEALRTEQAAEWFVRRVSKASGSDDYLLDKNGDFLMLGLKTGWTVKRERRNLAGI